MSKQSAQAKILARIEDIRRTAQVAGPEVAAFLDKLNEERLYLRHKLNELGKRVQRTKGPIVDAIGEWITWACTRMEQLEADRNRGWDQKAEWEKTAEANRHLIAQFVKAAAPFQNGGEFAHLGRIGDSATLVGLREGIEALRFLERFTAFMEKPIEDCKPGECSSWDAEIAKWREKLNAR